uniref:Uncharacterized protein n=1 Tax=Arundo donax TaxID=35708 RepID=A0A0A8YE76_ARUDO
MVDTDGGASPSKATGKGANLLCAYSVKHLLDATISDVQLSGGEEQGLRRGRAADRATGSWLSAPRRIAVALLAPFCGLPWQVPATVRRAALFAQRGSAYHHLGQGEGHRLLHLPFPHLPYSQTATVM